MQETNREPLREVTLGDLARAVVRLRWYVGGGGVAGLVLALAWGFLATPIYRSTVVVMPVSDRQPLPGALGGLLSQIGSGGLLGLGEDTRRNEAVALLKSRQLSLDVIRAENLMPVIFRGKWDPAAKRWRDTDPDQVPTEWDAWEAFDREVREVIEDRDRSLVSVQIELPDREQARRVATLLVQKANDELRERRLQALARSLELLQQELADAVLVELRQAIAQVMQAQISERMMINAQEDYAFRIIDAAATPDADRPERPKKALLAALGLAGGMLLGFLAGLLMAYRRGMALV